MRPQSFDTPSAVAIMAFIAGMLLGAMVAAIFAG
jgi:hypothetical protein